MMHTARCANARDDSGFTLVEMVIVTAVIATLAAIAVPTYVARRVAANEAAVIATLRAISQAQFQFKAMGTLDLNKDSGAEFGTLPELAAVVPLRGGSALNKPLLTVRLGKLDANGHTQTHGYLFCLYLPDDAGTGLTATVANGPLIDAGMSRDFWTCLAWPLTKGQTGNRTFFVSNHGEILKTRFPVYSGRGNVPPPGAGLTGVLPTHINSTELATDTVGADGSLWIVVQ